MKIALLLLACILFLSAAYSQGSDTIPSLSKERLIKKSRVQKTIGWFMVGTGIPVVAACVYFMTFPNDALSEKGKVAAALAGGVAYTIGGISLIKNGRRNKAMALALGLENRQLPLPLPGGTGFRRQTAIVFNFRL
jgi:hypothetical protein